MAGPRWPLLERTAQGRRNYFGAVSYACDRAFVSEDRFILGFQKTRIKLGEGYDLVRIELSIAIDYLY